MKIPQQRCVRCGYSRAEHENPAQAEPWDDGPCLRYEPPAPVALRGLVWLLGRRG